jgi:hypothetical protein
VSNPAFLSKPRPLVRGKVISAGYRYHDTLCVRLQARQAKKTGYFQKIVV